MLQVLPTCDLNDETTGAAVVAWIFMSIFTILIIGDAVATAFALAHAVGRDAAAIQRLKELESRATASKPKAPSIQYSSAQM